MAIFICSIFIILLVAFHYFIIAPHQRMKRSIVSNLADIDLYYRDLDRITTLIENARHKEHITTCCNEVYDFRRNYIELAKYKVPVQNDVDELIESIDKKYYQIKLRKPSFI